MQLKLNSPKLVCRLISIAVFFVLNQAPVNAQGNRLVITADSSVKGKDTILLGSPVNKHWKIRLGDDISWASPGYDDSGWKTGQSNFYVDSSSGKGWTGSGWLRIYLTPDLSLSNTSLGLALYHFGASEVYLNGARIAVFGRIGKSKETEKGYNALGNPVHLPLIPGRENLIAVRYSNYSIIERTFGVFIPVYPSGFTARIVDLNKYIRTRYDGAAEEYSLQLILFSVLFTLAIVHLLLFIYYSKSRPNLFYSLFALSLAVTFFLGFLSLVTRYPEPVKYLIVIQIYFLALIFSLFVMFLFSIYYKEMPKRVWLYHAAGLVVSTILLVTLFNPLARMALGAYILVCLLEGVRVVILAVKNKKDGALIIAGGVTGFLILMAFVLISNWVSVRFLPGWFLQSILYFGFLSIPASMSIFLARNFSKTNEDLEQKFNEVKELSEKTIAQERLEAELRLQNERKAKELEDARQVQMSMLPKIIPEDTGYEIAVHMQTAAEVGGDYYDFYSAKDELTVVLGDATGHGAKAGLMVTMAKTLFTAHAADDNLPDAFRKMSRTIKSMNLGMLYMAMSVFKLSRGRIRYSSAGMPPVLIFRAKSSDVEEVHLKAMPLGAFNEFPYEEKSFELNEGDVMLLMTDGFPELFNSTGEMLGYDKAAGILRQVAGLTPREVVSKFVDEINLWLKGRSQNDDITFLVIRKKGS